MTMLTELNKWWHKTTDPDTPTSENTVDTQPSDQDVSALLRMSEPEQSVDPEWPRCRVEAAAYSLGMRYPEPLNEFIDLPVGYRIDDFNAPSPQQWPKGRDLFLRDDMGQGLLRVLFDSDNDVIVAIWPEGEPSVSVEFCNGGGGGGKSLNTRKALIDLMCAMERDGAAESLGN